MMPCIIEWIIEYNLEKKEKKTKTNREVMIMLFLTELSHI